MLVLVSLLRCEAAITSTSQNLDEFSFKKGFKANGGLSLANTFYAGSDSLVTRDPYAFYLNGNLNMNLWGIAMPFSFSFSNTQKSFTQPFNRFKLDPRYKWVHLLIGSNSMNFSPYTLAGHMFNGVGVELTPEKWNIGAMYGRFNKAIEFDPKAQNYNTVAYKRIGYAAKVGYTPDFGEYVVSFFHGEDKENSISYVPAESYITPQKNTAVSVAVTQKFLKYFYVHGEYAFSLYNSNTFTESAGLLTDKNTFASALNSKSPEKYTDAINASAGYQGDIWGLAFNFERVAPNYTTLGGYYFNNDFENFTLAPNVKLLKGKINLTGNFGLQFNNLNGDMQSDTKRTVYSANASYSSGKAWNASLGFSNFTTFTKVKPESYPYLTDALDSLNFYQVSRSINGSTSYTFGSEEISDVISLSASYQTADMLNESVKTSFSDFYSGNLSFSQQYKGPVIGWSAFVNGSRSVSSYMKTSYFGPGLAINKGFINGKLSTGLSCNYNWNKVPNRDSGSLMNTGLNASYSIDASNKKLGNHTFSLSSGYTKYFGSMISGDHKYEFLTTLTYSVGF